MDNQYIEIKPCGVKGCHSWIRKGTGDICTKHPKGNGEIVFKESSEPFLDDRWRAVLLGLAIGFLAVILDGWLW